MRKKGGGRGSLENCVAVMKEAGVQKISTLSKGTEKSFILC